MERKRQISFKEFAAAENVWKARVHEVIFEADTSAGRAFDIGLIILILMSVIIVMLDSVQSYNAQYGRTFYVLEWIFTALFSIEYLLRLVCVKRPLRYATSFFGVIDLLAIIPTYLSTFFPGSQYMLVIRILRVLRIFRVLKLAHHTGAAQVLLTALQASRVKITVFLYSVFTIVVVLGSLMYLIEGEKNGFTSIPRAIYWAIVTLTTVGYGDISPQTALGQSLASVIMIVGYGIIAVPTGIVTVSLAEASRRQNTNTQSCPSCLSAEHDDDASFCKYCGTSLKLP